MLAFYLSLIDTPEDRNKFEILYQKYKQLLFHLAFQILNNTNDSEDVVQDTYIKVIEIIDKINDPNSSNTRALLAIIAENKAIDLYRKKKKRNVVYFDERTTRDTQQDVETVVLNSHAIANAIAKLPPKYRSVLILKFGQGFTTEEIGNILSMSKENVKKTIQRAKSKLEDALGEE